MKTTISILMLLIGLLASSYSVAAVHVETDKNDVILAGHDAVAYFTQGEPILGSSEYTASYDGAIYRFHSKSNRDTFRANPSAYAPQYGGFCAYGAALGKKFEVNGKAFEVVDGKLYVNKNEDVYETWVEDKIENINSADDQWVEIKPIAAQDL